MSEFKGTKGKWYHNKGTQSIWHPDKINYRLAVVDPQIDKYGKQTIEAEANTQLISKAPEMLEMLKTLLDNSDVPNEIYDQANQLIKEATTI